MGLLGLLTIPNETYAQTTFFGTPGSVLMCLNPSLPFVWLRDAPSSYAGVRGVLFPHDYAKLVKNGVGATSDGTQWWYTVSAFPTASQFFSGWVEASAFVGTGDSPANSPQGCPASDSPSEPRPTLVGSVCLNQRVPFIWERRAPSSYAPVEDTVYAASPCEGLAFPPMSIWGAFYWDGVQWWAQVAHAPREYSSRAWVEVKSLQQIQ